MASFDFSIYGDDDLPVSTNSTVKPALQKASIEPFDFSLYEQDEIAPQKQASLTPSEARKLHSKFESPKFPLLGNLAQTAKSALSSATFGQSEKLEVPGILSGTSSKPFKRSEEEREDQLLGESLGVLAPIGGAAKIASIPVNAAFKSAKGLLGTAKNMLTGALTGGLYKSAEQIAKGEELSPSEIGKTAAEFAVLPAVFEAVFKSVPGAYNWIKSLNTKQQSELLTKSVLPENLTPTQYKFYANEIVPELQKAAESEYKSLLDKSINEANKEYHLALRNTQAEHEKALYELANKKATQAQEQVAQQQYENKLKQVAAEHQRNLYAIESKNAQLLQEYNSAKEAFAKQKQREELIQMALKRPSESSKQISSVSKDGKDLGIRPTAPINETSSVKNKVGSLISPNKISNTYEAGEANARAIRANDAIDYKAVNDAYKVAEDLNAQVETTHPQLAQELQASLNESKLTPAPSAPQKQLQEAQKKILDILVETDSEGNIIGFKPVNNRVLLEQAKALRYSIDYDFAHGQPKGIFKPTINMLQDAAETASKSLGNEAALEAEQAARKLYRNWTETYNNDYINPYRDISNKSYSKLFDSSLSVDNYKQVESVLNKSPSGQALAQATRRELITNKLQPFLDDPRKALKPIFQETLDELKPILKPGEEQAIKSQISEARKYPLKKAVQAEKLKEPSKPNLKGIDSVKLPKPPKAKSSAKEITSVKLPSKPEPKITPEMRGIAKEIKITPEEAIARSNSPSGLKNLLNKLPEHKANVLAKEKVKDILYQGKVKPQYKGNELFKIINEGSNYDMLEAILGEDLTLELLEASEKIGNKAINQQELKKYIKKAAALRTLALFGIF